MPSYKNIRKETVLKAIENSQGIYSTIGKRLGCKSDTAERICNRWNETKQAVINEVELMLDVAENNIHKGLVKGDVQLSKWYLTMKGKSRGYETTPTIKLDNGEPLNINLSGSGEMTRDELLGAENVEGKDGES